jgi:hypothetical protein
VTDQITKTYQKIMAHDFDTGCGKKECDWCHFVRSNFEQPGKMLELVRGEEGENCEYGMLNLVIARNEAIPDKQALLAGIGVPPRNEYKKTKQYEI